MMISTDRRKTMNESGNGYYQAKTSNSRASVNETSRYSMLSGSDTS